VIFDPFRVARARGHFFIFTFDAFIVVILRTLKGFNVNKEVTSYKPDPEGAWPSG